MSVDQIEIPTSVLSQVLEKLADKRVAVEKEVLKYGEAPAGIKEVFELCRGFERAFCNIVNESPVARKIKDAFLGEKGLAGTVKELPLDKVFELRHVKLACRQADGYQPHMVSPEKGLRQLASEGLDLVNTPVRNAVKDVYALLISAAREAADKSGQFTESALMGAMPMYVPDFKNVVMPAITVALEEWREEAIKMALMLVDMERSYITAGFFRHTMHQRSQKIKAREALARGALAALPPQDNKRSNLIPSFMKKTPDGAPPAAGQAPGQPPTPGENKGAAGDESSDEDGPASTTGPARPTGVNMSNFQNPSEYIAAFFDKLASDDSTRQALPDALRWQRRFFVYHETLKMLYYFRAPEDVPKPNGLRGQVFVGECVVEDLDTNMQVRTTFTKVEDTKGGHLIRIRHRDPRGKVVKDHNSILLRAESHQQKMEWLTRFRNSLAAKKPEPKKVAANPANPDQAQAAPAPGVPEVMDFNGDLSWATEAEPVRDSHLGEGSSAFRAEDVRSADGMLLPAPSILLSPVYLADKLKKIPNHPQAHYEARYDALLEQFAHDMSVYTKMVCDTVVITVPKAIVHCMVKKAEKNLLERLFTVIHQLSPLQVEQLLREDPEVVLKRNASRRVLEDIKTGIFQVQQLLERQNMAGASDRRERMTLSADLFALSGLLDFLSPELRAKWSQKLNDPYIPDVMKFSPVAPPQPAVPPPNPNPPSAPSIQRTSMAPPSPSQGPPASGSNVPMRPAGQSPVSPNLGPLGSALNQGQVRPASATIGSGPLRQTSDVVRQVSELRKAPPPPANGTVPLATRRPPPPPPNK